MEHDYLTQHNIAKANECPDSTSSLCMLGAMHVMLEPVSLQQDLAFELENERTNRIIAQQTANQERLQARASAAESASLRRQLNELSQQMEQEKRAAAAARLQPQKAALADSTQVSKCICSTLHQAVLKSGASCYHHAGMSPKSLILTPRSCVMIFLLCPLHQVTHNEFYVQSRCESFLKSWLVVPGSPHRNKLTLLAIQVQGGGVGQEGAVRTFSTSSEGHAADKAVLQGFAKTRDAASSPAKPMPEQQPSKVWQICTCASGTAW